MGQDLGHDAPQAPPVMRAGGCGCCSISRRCFLGAVAAGAATLAGGCGGLNAMLKETRAEDVIDLAAMRPRPTVRIAGAVVRQPPPYWLGWPGASYPLEAERARYTTFFQDAAARVGVDYSESAPLESAEMVEGFIRRIQEERPDAVLIHMQHLSAWPLTDPIINAGLPTIIFSPVGTSFTNQVNRHSWKPGVIVLSSLEAPAVEQAFRAVRAKKQFAMTKLLLVKGDKRAQSVIDGLGVTLCTAPRAAMELSFQNTPETDEAKEVARWRFRQARKVVEPTRQDGINAGRSFVAAKRLLQAEGCNALTTDCLGMVTQKKVPTPPCMAASIFQDTGVTYGCEGDVNGALSLMLSSYLLDKPGFMNDPVPETVKNVLIASHCVCGTKLNGIHSKEQTPFILRSHSESNIGVSTQVLFPKREKVTLALFQGGRKLIVDTGTVVENVKTPPAGGCRTSVEIAMDRIEDSRNVLGFHQVVFLGDHRRDLEHFAQLCGIEVVHSPEHAEEPKPPAAKRA